MFEQNLSTVIDKLICDVKSKEDEMFQLTVGHRQMSRMFHHVGDVSIATKLSDNDVMIIRSDNKTVSYKVRYML